jgi:small conductance mechanosensitive channel
MNIKKRFEQENISLAYPVTTLDFGVKGGVNIFDKDIRVRS